MGVGEMVDDAAYTIVYGDFFMFSRRTSISVGMNGVLFWLLVDSMLLPGVSTSPSVELAASFVTVSAVWILWMSSVATKSLLTCLLEDSTEC